MKLFVIAVLAIASVTAAPSCPTLKDLKDEFESHFEAEVFKLIDNNTFQFTIFSLDS